MARTIAANTAGVTLSAPGDSPLTVLGGVSISGSSFGIYGSVTQDWSVANYGAVSAASGTGVSFKSGGSVTNSGVTSSIYGSQSGIVAIGMLTVSNQGTIIGAATSQNGIYLEAGGAVINSGTAALIFGGGHGVVAYKGPATINNQGTISGADYGGVVFYAGGELTNASGARIDGGYNGILDVYNTAATIINQGTIIGTSLGTFSLGVNLNIAGGTVINSGTAASIIGGVSGIASSGMLSLVNEGIIFGGKFDGVAVGAGIITNSGTAASIYGVDSGIFVGTAGSAVTVVNQGTIAAGTKSEGIYFGADGTLTNSGTVRGGFRAVQFSAGHTNLLVIDPGAVFVGTVDGGNTLGSTGVSTLELASGASVGTLAGLGSQFIDFSQVTIDAGASWTFVGSNTLAAGTAAGTFAGVNLEAGASVANTGTLSRAAGTLLYSSAAGVSVTNTGVVVENAGTNSAISVNGNVSNAVGATISGWRGVHLTGAADTLFNAGTIIGTGTTQGADVLITAGGTVSNAATGTISAFSTGIYVTGASGAVINAGDIINSGTNGDGIQLTDGGFVSNAAAGTISSVPHNAINIAGGSGTVMNAGLITNVGSVSGSNIVLLSGGLVSNASTGTITSPQRTDVYINGGLGTVVNAGLIQEGGSHAAVVLQAGGIVTNQLGGTIIGGPFHDGVYITVGSGTVINDGLLLGGTSGGVDLRAGGTIANLAGGTISAGTVAGHSAVFITGASAAVIDNAGLIHGIALHGSGTIVNAASGIIDGDTANGIFATGAATTVTNAGAITGFGTFAAISFVAGYADRLIVDPGAVFAGAVNGGNPIGSTIVSTLELASAASRGVLSGVGTEFINFAQTTIDAGAAWTLQFPNPDVAHSSIGGFATGDTLALTGIDPTSVTLSAGTLTFAGGGFPLSLAGATGVEASGDGSGGALVTVACFREGTRIRTPQGDVPVENLRVGDDVVTLLGIAPTVRIGHRSIDCSRHPEPRNVWPVRIAKGAFGDDWPCRELFLSPDHAVFVDDVLIPVKHLINGTTIVQVPVGQVMYYHVGLARHDVLLAEGLAAESYLDTSHPTDLAVGNVISLHPDLASRTWEAAGCAPLVVCGPRLDAVRAGIRLRAQRTRERPHIGNRAERVHGRAECLQHVHRR